MYAFIIAFLVIATIVALGTLIYVVIDIILDRIRKEIDEAKVEEPVYVPMPVIMPEPEPEPIPEPEPEPIPVPIIIPAPAFDHIDASEADAILTDEIAMDSTRKESGAGHGRGAEINIGTIDQHFEQGEIITIDALKEKKLIGKKDCRIKVLADGILTKSFTIKAEAFSVQAVKMIELMGGTVIILVD